MGIKNLFFKTRSVVLMFYTRITSCMGWDWFLKRNKNSYRWEDLYCRGKCTFGGGEDLIVLKPGFLVFFLFDLCNNPVKLGKMAVSVPIWQMKKLRSRAVKLCSWDFVRRHFFGLSFRTPFGSEIWMQEKLIFSVYPKLK